MRILQQYVKFARRKPLPFPLLVRNSLYMGIVFTHGVRMGRRAAGKGLPRLYLRNH